MPDEHGAIQQWRQGLKRRKVMAHYFLHWMTFPSWCMANTVIIHMRRHKRLSKQHLWALGITSELAANTDGSACCLLEYRPWLTVVSTGKIHHSTNTASKIQKQNI